MADRIRKIKGKYRWEWNYERAHGRHLSPLRIYCAACQSGMLIHCAEDDVQNEVDHLIQTHNKHCKAKGRVK